MKTRFLLPYKAKQIGLVLLIPCLLIGIMTMHFDFQIDSFEIKVPYGGFLNNGPTANNLTDELASVLLIACLVLIAFAEEKVEDEWVTKIRLESLQWAVYINYGLLILAILLVYNELFFEALVYNMFTILIIFILRFNYVLNVSFNPNRITSHEE